MSSGRGDEPTDQLLSYIHACIRSNRYAFHPHALEYHPALEGFTASHALEAIFDGTIIENSDIESKCLICGHAEGLARSSEFISNYIHCSVAYDRVLEVVIITMYRPRSDLWLNQYTRRH